MRKIQQLCCLLLCFFPVLLFGCKTTTTSEPQTAPTVDSELFAQNTSDGTGSMTHGFAQDITNANPLLYNGETVAFTYNIENTGNSDNTWGLVLYLNGCPQPYQTASKTEDVLQHHFSVKAGEKCEIPVRFTPVAGTSGDTLMLYVAVVNNPLYRAVENSLTWGVAHSYSQVMPVPIKFEADAPTQVQSTPLSGDYSEKFPGWAYSSNTTMVRVADGYDAAYISPTSKELTVSISGRSLDHVYRLSVFVNHKPITICGGKSHVDVAVKADTMLTVTVEPDQNTWNSQDFVYVVLAPVNWEYSTAGAWPEVYKSPTKTILQATPPTTTEATYYEGTQPNKTTYSQSGGETSVITPPTSPTPQTPPSQSTLQELSVAGVKAALPLELPDGYMLIRCFRLNNSRYYMYFSDDLSAHKTYEGIFDIDAKKFIGFREADPYNYLQILDDYLCFKYGDTSSMSIGQVQRLELYDFSLNHVKSISVSSLLVDQVTVSQDATKLAYVKQEDGCSCVHVCSLNLTDDKTVLKYQASGKGNEPDTLSHAYLFDNKFMYLGGTVSSNTQYLSYCSLTRLDLSSGAYTSQVKHTHALQYSVFPTAALLCGPLDVSGQQFDGTAIYWNTKTGERHTVKFKEKMECITAQLSSGGGYIITFLESSSTLRIYKKDGTFITEQKLSQSLIWDKERVAIDDASRRVFIGDLLGVECYVLSF